MTGAFRNVALAVLEVEAAIAPVRVRWKEQMLRLWIAVQSLDYAHPV